jgi:Enoyl-CoA hydratase/isomerase
MTTKLIELTRPTAQVARVFLNRPDVRNAFNEASIAELTRTFAELSQDTQLRAIVLGGHGKAFCAGADLGWMRSMADYSWDQNRADAQALADMLWTIYRCPVPVVGRVHGDCYAGGVGLAAVCDVLVVADGVNFCLSEARLGLLPATISPYVIRALGGGEVAPPRRTRSASCTRSARRTRSMRRSTNSLLRSSPTARWPRVPARRWCRTWAVNRSPPRCVKTPRGASPTSAPVPRARRACRAS